MFWDGTRWIEEGAPAATSAPSRRWIHNWLAVGLMIVAVAIPVVAANAAASKATTITVDAVAGRGPIPTERSVLVPAPPPVATLVPPADAGGPAPSAHIVAPAALPQPTPDRTGKPPSRVTPVANPTLMSSPALTPGPTPAQTGAIRALGVYVHNSAWDYSLIDAYASTVGAMPAMALSYQDWAPNADDGQLFPTAMLKAFASRGIVNILTWQPFDWNAGGAQSGYALSTILSGAHDAYIQTWVAAAKAYGKPVYIRFAHEMNIPGAYPWCMGINGNTPTQFVAAWRYVVDRFRADGATNVKWVWSPHTVDTDKPLTGLYPGDAYVDMIGLDGYNWGTAKDPSWLGWRTFTQIFGATYAQVRALAPSKPVFVTEMASTELGGDKPAWIRTAFDDIPINFPELAGVIWFDQNKETDWRVDSSSASLIAFREVATRTTWQGNLP